MGNLFDALKAGAKASVGALSPGPYAVVGREVRCGHCSGTAFRLRAVATSEVGELGIAAFALLCDGCGHVEFFDRMPDRL